MVKSVIDLHGIEVAGVVGKPTPLRDIGGVKDPPPVVILVARSSDA
jgi:hypothetical protein